MLLHLLDLLDLQSSPTVLPSLLSRHVEANTGPSGENLCRFTGASITGCAALQSVKFSLGGPAGGRTRVRNAFALKGLQQSLYLYYNKKGLK